MFRREQADAKRKTADWLAKIAKESIDRAKKALEHDNTISSTLNALSETLKQQRKDFMKTMLNAMNCLGAEDENSLEQWQNEAKEMIEQLDEVIVQLSSSNNNGRRPHHRNVNSIYENTIQQLFLHIGNIANTTVVENPENSNQAADGIVSAVAEKPDDIEQMEIFLLEESCEDFLNSSKHTGAFKLVQRLLKIQPEGVRTNLVLAESLFKLERHEECFEVIKKIRDMTSSLSKENLITLLQTGVKRRAAGNGYISTLVLLWSSCLACCKHYDPNNAYPNDALEGIILSLRNMDDLTQDVKNEAVALKAAGKRENLNENFSKLFFRVNEDVQSLLDKMKDVDIKPHTVARMRCTGSKADWLRTLGSHDEALSIYQQCINKMEECFGEQASEKYMYGEFLVNAALCFSEIGDKSNAEEFMMKSKEAMKNSEPATPGEIARKEAIGKKFEKILAKTLQTTEK